MKRRKIALLLCATMLFATITGCADNSDTASQNTTTSQVDESTDTSSQDESASVEADPFGAYAETVTFGYGKSVSATDKFLDGDTQEDNQYTRHIADTLNIQVLNEWEAASGSDYDQKVNLAIASDDIPDGLVVNDTQFSAMVRAGQLADLSEVYEMYGSPIMKQIYNSNQPAIDNVTRDGQMLALPNSPVPDDGYTLIWVRQDWLDALGLDPPETVEDVKNIAAEFIEKDPGGNGPGNTIGITGPANGAAMYCDFMSPMNVTNGFDPIFSAHGAYPGFWVKDENGETAYGSVLPETREALITLSEMYADGLIDPQMGVRKDSNEAIVSGQAGMFAGVWWNGYSPFPDAWNTNPEADWQAYMLKDESGVINNHMGSPSTAYAVVSKDYEHPEVAVLLNNVMLRDESSFDLNNGNVGNFPMRVALGAYDEMVVTRDALESVFKGESTIDDYKTEEYAPYKLLINDIESITKVKLEPFDALNISAWDRDGDPNFNRLYSIFVGTNPFYTQDVNMIYSETYGQTPGMETKWVNLEKLEEETFLKIVMGVEPIETWDQFVIDWKAQGGDEITEEVKALG